MRKKKREITNYLLGNTANPELEKELMTNNDLFEELLIQEDEIIDEYVRWQTTFLASSERQWNMRFAQVFNRYLVERGGSDTQARTIP
jgi:hypothetical protein